jgi:hypothetical protein
MDGNSRYLGNIYLLCEEVPAPHFTPKIGEEVFVFGVRQYLLRGSHPAAVVFPRAVPPGSLAARAGCSLCAQAMAL